MRISGHVTHRLRVKRELLAHIKLTCYDQAASVCLKLGHTKKHTHGPVCTDTQAQIPQLTNMLLPDVSYVNITLQMSVKSWSCFSGP